MGKKWMLALTLLALALLGAAVWLAVLAREPEPVYQGRPLSYWLNGFTSANANDPFPDKPQAELAIRELGTNCIPTLLRMMHEKGSIPGFLITLWAYKLHMTKHEPASIWEHNYQAEQGFRALGDQASNAVPALIEIYQGKADTRSARVRQIHAINALGFIGKGASPAIPGLLREIADSNSVLREDAIRAVGNIHSEPEMVVPVLIDLLTDPDTNIRRTAIRALGHFGTYAKSAIPQLYELLKNQGVDDSDVRDALLKIDPDAPTKLQKYPPPPEPSDGS